MPGRLARPLVLVLTAAGLLCGVIGEAVLNAAADPEKGKVAFEKCAACHSLEETKTDGPTLKGVFGRRAGSLEDYRYSVALKRSAVVWDKTTLDRYIADPQDFVKGNRMAFVGISDPSERDDLIAYLEQMNKPPERQ